MKGFVLLSAICLQLGWSYAGHSNGVGAFAAQDSSGKRYEGTYGLKDGEVIDAKGTFPPGFKPTDFEPSFDEPDNFIGFFPEYFRNLENLLQDPGFTYYARTPQTPQYIQSPSPFPYSPGMFNTIPDYGLSPNIPDYTPFELVSNHIPNYGYYNNNMNRAFQANLDNQRLALEAAHKAFDLTSNQAGISHDLNPFRLNSFSGFPAGFPNMPAPQFPHGFPFQGGFPMPDFGNGASNSAYAGAAVGPGYSHQVAAVSPPNPNSPNVFKSSQGSGNPGGFKSVSVSSFASSSNLNGRKTAQQGSHTMINDNGQISQYSVHSP